MDAVILNIFQDIPIVTRCWTLSCIALSALTTINLVDSSKTLYNYDLVFHKGQYQRLFYSLIDYGELNLTSVLNIFIGANHMTMLENSFPTKRRFIWMMFLILNIILAMTSYEQPLSTLGSILHENLVYYQIKKYGVQAEIIFLGGIDITPTILQIYKYALMYFIYRRSWLEISMHILPAHIMFYLDDIINKLYEVDLCKTPYDYWVDWQ